MPASGGGSGDSNVFYVTIRQGNGSPVVDKTYEEVVNAYEAGKQIIGRKIEPDNNAAFLVPLFVKGDTYFMFNAFSATGSNGILESITNTQIVYSNSGNITYHTHTKAFS